VRAISAVLALLSLAVVWVSTSPRLAATSRMKRISVVAAVSSRASMTTTTDAATATPITIPTAAMTRFRTTDARR
jgi:hypothetical protein